MIDEAVAVPIIVGIIEVFKNVGLPSRFAPIMALVLGVGYALATGGMTLQSGIVGLALGLSAAGLFSGGKALLKKEEEEE